MNHPRAIDLDTLLDSNGVLKGHDVRTLGPSDSSDSGADIAGDESEDELDSTSDRNGTGERMSAENEDDGMPGSDIAPDRIANADEVGLGGGLDQAEEAQLGITDEEIDDAAREKLGLDD